MQEKTIELAGVSMAIAHKGKHASFFLNESTVERFIKGDSIQCMNCEDKIDLWDSVNKQLTEDEAIGVFSMIEAITAGAGNLVKSGQINEYQLSGVNPIRLVYK